MSYEFPDRVLIGEPVTREDGIVFSVYKTPSGIEQMVGHITFAFSDEQVLELGQGKWDRGLVRIANDAYADPRSDIDRFARKSRIAEEL